MRIVKVTNFLENANLIFVEILFVVAHLLSFDLLTFVVMLMIALVMTFMVNFMLGLITLRLFQCILLFDLGSLI